MNPIAIAVAFRGIILLAIGLLFTFSEFCWLPPQTSVEREGHGRLMTFNLSRAAACPYVHVYIYIYMYTYTCIYNQGSRARVLKNHNFTLRGTLGLK